MAVTIKKIIGLCAAVSVIVLGSCKTTKPIEKPAELPKKPVAAAQFTGLTWLAEYMSPSFWGSGAMETEKAEMYISFFLTYTGTFSNDQIKRLIIYSPRDFWLITDDQFDNVFEDNPAEKRLAIKRLKLDDASGGLALGEWSVFVEFTNGTEFSKAVTVQAFNSTAKDGETIYLVPAAKKNTDIAALAMPVIDSVTKTEDSIDIRFTINDGRVKNAYFWLDVPGEKYFRDAGSMTDAGGTLVNGCQTFNTNGKQSWCVIKKDADNAAWFDTVTQCFLVITDMHRINSPWEETIRTVSAAAAVK